MHVTSSSSTVQRDGAKSSFMGMASIASLSSEVGCNLEVFNGWTSGLDGTEHFSEVFVGLKGMTGGPIWMLVACLPVATDIMNPLLLKVLLRSYSLNYYYYYYYTCNYMQRY